MNISKYEQETIINYNEEESTASVYTHSRKLRNKLHKISKENSDCQILKETDEHSEFIVPKKWIKVSPPKKLSAESLARMSELGKQRMRELHNKGQHSYAKVHSFIIEFLCSLFKCQIIQLTYRVISNLYYKLCKMTLEARIQCLIPTNSFWKAVMNMNNKIRLKDLKGFKIYSEHKDWKSGLQRLHVVRVL